MLKILQDEFHGWGYIKFSKLDQYIRNDFKETFMAKEIYLSILNGHMNQWFANFVMDEQLPVWDKIELKEHKYMYLTSKTWVLLELRYSYASQLLNLSVEVKINLIDDRRQLSFTPGSINTLGLTTLIKEPLAEIPLL